MTLKSFNFINVYGSKITILHPRNFSRHAFIRFSLFAVMTAKRRAAARAPLVSRRQTG
jgi:hypothetical protein